MIKDDQDSYLTEFKNSSTMRKRQVTNKQDKMYERLAVEPSLTMHSMFTIIN